MPISLGRARSSLAFDWVMGVLAFLMVCGPLIDGWAHQHGKVDQSFLTPWHALLYGAMALNGLVLLGAGIAGLRRGYSFVNALPAAYWVSAIGVVLFIAGGAFDAWWHTQFGIETGIALLISPSHLLLGTAGGMITVGPLLSIASQYGRDASGWKILGPAIVATWGVLTILSFFLAYAQPIEDGFTPLTMRRDTSGNVYPVLYRADRAGTVTRVALPANLDLETVDVSPDGKRMVYRVNRYQNPDALPPSDLEVADINGLRRNRITDSARHDTQPAWSPDGRWIAYVSMPAETSGDFEIRLTPPDGGSEHTLVDQPTTISQVTWSPDGKMLAFGSRNGVTPEIGVVNVASPQVRWLPFTAGGSQPVWTRSGIVYSSDDGSIRVSSLDGRTRVLVTKADGSPAVSRDGKSLAYLNPEYGGDQLWITDLHGHARDVSQLSGFDVQDAAWAADGSVLFVATGRRDAVHSGIGKELAMASIILEGIVVAGAILALVRRFIVPFGTCTFILTFYAIAMALQSDFYIYAAGAFATGLIADIAIALLGERARDGVGFYALGFFIPFLFTIAFESVTSMTMGGMGWIWNLASGAPVLAGIAGLFVAFCFASPLEAASGGSAPS